MLRARALLALTIGVLAAVAAPTSGVAAADATLVPDEQDARAGATITMTGNFCATGLAVESLDVSLAQPYPKAPIMTFPLDPVAVGLVQTDTGFSFSYTVAGDRQFVWFTVRCSDGSEASSGDVRVTVWPPYGELWFIYPYPTPAYGTAGETIEAVVHSIDCVEGSTATAQLRRSGSVIASGSGVLTDHWLYAPIEVPSDAPAGEDYSLRVACTGTEGGTITDDHPAIIAGGSGGPTTTEGSLPAAGTTSGGLASLAAGLAALGVLAIVVVRRGTRAEVSDQRAP